MVGTEILFQFVTVTVTNEMQSVSEIRHSGFSSVNIRRDRLLSYLGWKANLHTTNNQTKTFGKISIGFELESCYIDTVQAPADRLPSAFLSLPDGVYTFWRVCRERLVACDWHWTREQHTNGVMRSLVYIHSALKWSKSVWCLFNDEELMSSM